MSLPAALPDNFDPSVPLADPRYERFAQLRVALGLDCYSAAKEAELPVTHRNAPRYDRHPEVVARKAYLAKDDADVVAVTRLFCRDRLMQWASTDVLANYAIIGTAEVEGRKVPRVIGVNWRKLKSSQHSSAVTGFKFDRETGVLVDFTVVQPDGAVNQLRDMYGFKAPRRTELTGRGGGPVQTLDVTKYTDEELIQLESILTAAATRSGVDVGTSGDRAEDSAPATEPASAERNVIIPSNGR